MTSALEQILIKDETLPQLLHCYCDTTKKEFNMIPCLRCKKCFHLKCFKSPKPTSLEGDIFFTFTCANCSAARNEIVTRMKMSWAQVVSLALYNLHLTSTGKCGYFKWREQICGFIEKHWTSLFQNAKKRSNSWHSSVAGVLSSGSPHYFRTGGPELQESGWWSLTTIKPPTLDLDIRPKSERVSQTQSSSSEHLKLDGPRTRKKPNSIKRAIELKEKRATTQEAKDMRKMKRKLQIKMKPQPVPKQEPILLTYAPESQSQNSESISSSVKAETVEELSMSSGSGDLFSARDLLPSESLPALLLADDRMNCSDSDFEVDPCSITPVGSPTNFSNQFEISDMISSLSKRSSFSEDTAENSILNAENSQDSIDNCSTKDSFDSDADNEDSEEAESEVSEDESFTAYTKIRKFDIEECTPPEPTLQPLSVYEEQQLLHQLNDISSKITLDPATVRLKRKLALRQLKRKRGIQCFDLDAVVSKLTNIPQNIVGPPKLMPSSMNRYNIPTSSSLPFENRILDRFQHGSSATVEKSKISFLNRLVGVDDYQLKPITSPYSARVLKPFIRRDYESKPRKLKLLEEIIAYPHRNDPNWKPSQSAPIDYCYVRPQHIPSVNNYCHEFFWPGIDLSECLHYPEFSCVVLYRKFVIGFSFMVPDVKYNESYISFFFIHPEWRRAGIATFMLYHLIQTCMGKDVTLHVSANNPAMVLYQKFGFKPEEYILDFYDKYFKYSSKECRHAFLLRLRR